MDYAQSRTPWRPIGQLRVMLESEARVIASVVTGLAIDRPGMLVDPAVIARYDPYFYPLVDAEVSRVDREVDAR